MIKAFLRGLKRTVSPVFIALFVASFVLWYIAKLNYTYTADYVVKLNVDGYRLEVPCVVEGVGSNLMNHKIKIGKRFRIPMSELEHRDVYTEDSVRMIAIDPVSMRNALAVRISDIKIISLGEIPAIDPNER